MKKGLRSESSKSLADTLSAEEADLIRKQLVDKERQLRAQSESIAAREMELQKQTEQFTQANFDTRGLQNIITELHKEVTSLRDLPNQLRTLETKVEAMREPAPTPPHSQNGFAPRNETFTIPSTTTSTAPFEPSPIRLKDVADSIPKYDGQKISVFQFAKICERALDLIPAQHERYLVQLIISRLQGHAYTAIEGSHFTDVCTLTRKLKQIFGPNKSLNQYKGELGNAYMKPNESIFDYIGRIKELRSAIIDGEYELHRTLDDWAVNMIDRDVLESFINGLNPVLIIRVKLEGFHDLDDAYIKAIQVSKTLESEAIRRKLSYANKQATPLARQDIFPPNFRSSREQLSVDPNQPSQPRSILQRSGNPFIKPLIPGQPGPNAPSSIFCRYCKTPGHMINNCKKLQYRNSFSHQPYSSDQLTNLPGPSKETNISGNAPLAPVKNDVRRDATEPTGRRSPIARFQNDLNPTIITTPV